MTITATGQLLTETFAAALTGILATAHILADPVSAAGHQAEMAIPIRGEGQDLAALILDLAGDLLHQVVQHRGVFAPVELDGVIRTDDGLSTWGYLHGRVAPGCKPLDIELAGTPTIECDARGDVTGLTLRLRVCDAKDRLES